MSSSTSRCVMPRVTGSTWRTSCPRSKQRAARTWRAAGRTPCMRATGRRGAHDRRARGDIALANRGPVTCTVHGYPQVVLYGANGDVLPFHYATGGGAYVTSGKPVTVVLAHGASAYILVAKYRCDLGIVRNATAIRLTLPAAHGGVLD